MSHFKGGGVGGRKGREQTINLESSLLANELFNQRVNSCMNFCSSRVSPKENNGYCLNYLCVGRHDRGSLEIYSRTKKGQ